MYKIVTAAVVMCNSNSIYLPTLQGLLDKSPGIQDTQQFAATED